MDNIRSQHYKIVSNYSSKKLKSVYFKKVNEFTYENINFNPVPQ